MKEESIKNVAAGLLVAVALSGNGGATVFGGLLVGYLEENEAESLVRVSSLLVAGGTVFAAYLFELVTSGPRSFPFSLYGALRVVLRNVGTLFVGPFLGGLVGAHVARRTDRQ